MLVQCSLHTSTRNLCKYRSCSCTLPMVTPVNNGDRARCCVASDVGVAVNAAGDRASHYSTYRWRRLSLGQPRVQRDGRLQTTTPLTSASWLPHLTRWCCYALCFVVARADHSRLALVSQLRKVSDAHHPSRIRIDDWLRRYELLCEDGRTP